MYMHHIIIEFDRFLYIINQSNITSTFIIIFKLSFQISEELDKTKLGFIERFIKTLLFVTYVTVSVCTEFHFSYVFVELQDKHSCFRRLAKRFIRFFVKRGFFSRERDNHFRCSLFKWT